VNLQEEIDKNCKTIF
jgi:uncharacterized protein (DUF2164 family)